MSDHLDKTPKYYRLPNGKDLLSIFPTWITRGYCIVSIFKYVWRAGNKTADPLPDLKKAAHCLEILIGSFEEEQNEQKGEKDAA